MPTSSSPDPSLALRNTPSGQGFAYFSGAAENNHNHPAIYAHGSSSGETLTVTGRGSKQSFPMSEFDAAIAHYKEQLEKQGYHPGQEL